MLARSDIEGAEWSVLESMLSSATSRKLLASGKLVRQLQFELHFHVLPNRPKPWSGPPAPKPRHGGYARSPEHSDPDDVRAFNKHAQEMLDQLHDLGFRAWTLDTNRGAPTIPFEEEMHYIDTYFKGWPPSKDAWHKRMRSRLRVSCCHDLTLLWHPEHVKS